MKLKLRQWLVGNPRRREFPRLGVLLFAPLVVACSDTTGPSQFVSITPANESVALQTVPSGKILRTSVTLTNTSGFPVTWGGGCGLSLEKKIDVVSLAAADGPTPPWFTVWWAVCTEAVAVVSSPILYSPLQPGQSVSIPIDIPVTPSGTQPRFDGSPGEYRVHLMLTTQIFRNQYRLIPHDLSVSDSFSIVAQ